MSILGKRESKGKTVNEFYFCIEIDLRYYFHATWAPLEGSEIFDNFDHIFTLFLSLFRPLKVGMTPMTKNSNCKYKYLTKQTQLSR